MRCLLLDNNVTYINPTRRLFVDALGRAFDLCIFGPGYVSAADFKAGPEEFAEKNGPIDVVIATEQILLPHYYSKEHLLSGVWQAHAYKHPTEWMTSKAPFDFLRSFDKAKIISFLQSDFYSVKTPIIDLVEDSDAYVIGAGPEFLRTHSSAPNAKLHRAGTDLWRQFVERRKNRVISLTHFIHERELSNTPLADRKYDVSVPGAHYDSRLHASEDLQRNGAGLDMPSEVWTRNVLRLRSYLKLDGTYLGIKFLNTYFFNQLSNSRVVFTSPGALGYAIRKYFEIPAAGALLAGVPCEAFNALGFANGDNAVICDPSQLADLAREVKRNPASFQKIVDAGREVVEKKHGVAARAVQIQRAVKAILGNEFRGSEWRNGEFTLV